VGDQRDGGIAWCDETWNPVRGCSRVSEGCRFCYAERVAARFAGPGQPYEGLAEYRNGRPRWTGKVRLIPEHLGDPVRWRRPRKIFVNSMSDLFHESLGNEEIAAVFGVMATAQNHIFQVLTKRPERALAWFSWAQDKAQGDPLEKCVNSACDYESDGYDVLRDRLVVHGKWPLPNVWIGSSVEDQKTADERLDRLKRIPAVIRFVSAEPLLGPIDFSADRARLSEAFNTTVGAMGYMTERGFSGANRHPNRCTCQGNDPIPHKHRSDPPFACARCLDCPAFVPVNPLAGIHQVIVGGESGPGARLFNLAWARSILKQCREAGVAFFMKQVGALPQIGETETMDQSGMISKMYTHLKMKDRAGADPGEWPEDIRVQEFPPHTQIVVQTVGAP